MQLSNSIKIKDQIKASCIKEEEEAVRKSCKFRDDFYKRDEQHSKSQWQKFFHWCYKPLYSVEIHLACEAFN